MKKIVFASDFAPIRHFSQLLKDDPASVYGDMGGILRRADYAIVNLESPLHCPDGFIAKSGAAFSGEVEHISALTAGNFQAAVLANNHAFDCGFAGFARTKELLLSHGIMPVGAGENLAQARKPLTFELDGIRVALFTISEGEDMMGAKEDSPECGHGKWKCLQQISVWRAKILTSYWFPRIADWNISRTRRFTFTKRLRNLRKRGRI